MFTILLGTLISVLLNAVLTLSLIFIFFIVRDIRSGFHQHLTRWLICALNFIALKYCLKLLRSSNSLAEIFIHIFLTFVFLSHFKAIKLEVFTYINKRLGTLFRLDEVSAILQAQHIRALLSRSSGVMKFDSSSLFVKPGLLRFCGDHVRGFFFLQTTNFVPLLQSSVLKIIKIK